MAYQGIPDEYKDDLKSDFHQELCHKIGKHNSSCIKNAFTKNRLTFRDFFNGIAAGNQECIVHFAQYLQFTKNIEIEFFIDKSELAINFMGNLIQYAINSDENYLSISEPALIALSKLLKANSIQIIDLILTTKVELNGEETTFCERLLPMTHEPKTEDQKRALLKCIAVMSNIIPQLEEFFIDFFVKQLSDKDHRSLQKTAASSACQIICNNPDSNFSEQIAGSLPLDIQDPELSKYCFNSLIARCDNGNCYCFDIPQMIDLACNCYGRISYDAVQLLISASVNSPIICEYLLNNIPFDKLLQDVENSKCICLLISSIIRRDSSFANSFISLLDNLLQLYYESKLNDKIFIVEVICLIILNVDAKLIGVVDPIYELLLEGIYLDNDIIGIIIDTLHHMNYGGYDFRQVLLDQIYSDDVPVNN